MDSIQKSVSDFSNSVLEETKTVMGELETLGTQALDSASTLGKEALDSASSFAGQVEVNFILFCNSFFN
jgi:hypothetical protein